MCFSLSWIENLLIWLVIVIAIVAILRILIPWILSMLGTGSGNLMAIINVFIWAFVVIFVIYIAFALIECLLASGGSLSLLPKHAWLPLVQGLARTT